MDFWASLMHFSSPSFLLLKLPSSSEMEMVNLLGFNVNNFFPSSKEDWKFPSKHHYFAVLYLVLLVVHIHTEREQDFQGWKMHCTATIAVVVLFSVWEKWCYCYCRRPLCIRPNGSQKGIPSAHFMFRSKERLQPYLASGKKSFYNIKIDWLSNFPSEIKRRRTCSLLWKTFSHLYERSEILFLSWNRRISK